MEGPDPIMTTMAGAEQRPDVRVDGGHRPPRVTRGRRVEEKVGGVDTEIKVEAREDDGWRWAAQTDLRS